MRARVGVMGVSLARGVYWLVLRVLSAVVPDPLEVDRMVGIVDGKEKE